MRQRLRQSRRAHPYLDAADVVGHAPEFNGTVFQVGNRKTCSGIAVAWLPDRTWIQQITLFIFDLQGAKQLVSSRMQLQHFQLRIQISKTALVMSVPVEGYLRGGVQQTFERL